MSILVQIFENLNFRHNFRKISILVKFSEILILVEIFENLSFGRNFRKPIFWSKLLKNFDFAQYLRKNHEFSRNFRKISILVEIV